MTVLIVGADRIGSFVPKLKDLGVEDIVHWSARNCRSSKNTIPKKTELVICCTDFLNHNTARMIKKQIKERNLPAVYCRRAWCELAPEVEQMMQDHRARQKNGEKDTAKDKKCRGCGSCSCTKTHH